MQITILIVKGGTAVNNSFFYYDIIFILLLFVLAYFLTKLNKPYVVHEHFDEMQMMYRLKAYQAAFFTCITLLTLSALYLQFIKAEIIEPLTLIYATLLISVGVFADLCILHGSYDSYNPRQLWLWVLINGFASIVRFVKHSLIVDGKITTELVTVLMFLLYFSMAVCTEIRKRRDARENEEE